MPNEKHDPWALLAEAMDAFESWNDLPHVEWTSLCARMNAALAEREAEAKVEMEWCTVGSDCATTYPDDGIELTVIRFRDGAWKWWTKREYVAQGTAATEAEAKEAAIRAARGVR